MKVPQLDNAMPGLFEGVRCLLEAYNSSHIAEMRTHLSHLIKQVQANTRLLLYLIPVTVHAYGCKLIPCS